MAMLNNEELYNHDNDPEEHVNLVGNSKYTEILEELRKTFESSRKNARGGL